MASANDVRLNLELFCPGARTKTSSWRLDLDPSCVAPKIRFSNKQDMYNFVTELNLRFFKVWKTLNDYFNTILSPKINDFYNKHNNVDIPAYLAQLAAIQAALASLSTTSSSSSSTSLAGVTTTQQSTTTTTTTTTITNPLPDPGAAYTGIMNLAPYSYRRWWAELNYVMHTLVLSCLYWDGLYTGVLVQPYINWKLPPYIFTENNSTVSSNTVYKSYQFPASAWTKSGCDCYEDAWKTYYQNIIDLRTRCVTERSGSTNQQSGKQMIDYIKKTVIPSMPRRFFVMPDNGNESTNFTAGYTCNVYVNAGSVRDCGWMQKLSSYGLYYSMIEAIGEDIKDWTYNRWKNINLSDYVTKAKAALKAAEEFDDTGEFTKWIKESGFKVLETLPQNPRLVYLSGTGPDMAFIDFEHWYKTMGYDPSPYGSPTENPFNLDIYCSTNDIIEGRVKATADEFVI